MKKIDDLLPMLIVAGMITRFLLLLLCLCAFNASEAYAASKILNSVTGKQAADVSPDANPENIKNLIETLESDTARTEFLNNLKMLLDQQEKNEEAQEAQPLTEQIGVRGFISSTVAKYEDFLSRNNLSGSVITQFIGSVVVLIVALALLLAEKRLNRKLIRLTDKLSAFLGVGVSRLRFYARLLHIVARFIILSFSLYTLMKIWRVEFVNHIFESDTLQSFMSTALTVMLVIFLAALFWETINLYLSYALRKADSNNQTRTKTLVPIIRNIFFAIFGGLFGLVLLSELGVNVTPLLAGAGVLGIAIGFGAQSIVKDFLTGFMIVLEDLVRVGDVVNLGGHSGVIEKITLRKIQLRDIAGAVFTIPYSEITVIQNLTKDFSYYVLDLSVPYDQSIDDVIRIMNEVDESLRKDDIFSFMILEPIEILGVDKFAESAMVIKARIKTAPIRQWRIGREFNKRLKMAFDAAGIRMPLPQRVVRVHADSTATIAASSD